MIEGATGFPLARASSVPAVTAAVMARVERIAFDEFGIGSLQLMDQAGSDLAELVRAELGGHLSGRRVVVAVGSGETGGAGLAGARHLANQGASVRVILARPVNRLGDASRHQVTTLLEMAIDCCVALYDLPTDQLDGAFAAADVVIDAVLGYRSGGPSHDAALMLVDHLARVSVPLVSLDLPSGVDADSGETPGTAVTASATMTFGLPKPGLFLKAGPAHAGRLFLGDIGIPAELYRRLGFEPGVPFVRGPIIELEVGG